MLFNSLEFAVFLPVVFALYWLVGARHIGRQNLLLLLASYLFYAQWDWRYLLLIVLSSVVDYLVARGLGRTAHSGHRKALLWLSIGINLGILGFFKYYDFFVESFVAGFTLLGSPVSISSLKLVLPVGISFYTFQTMSYSIDVYRRKLEPQPNFVAFAAFVSFFPQLVAGPIERASRLLPQFTHQRNFNYAQATDGLRQLVWGLFKKVVIADNCARFVDLAFGAPEAYSGSTLLLALLLFVLQVYGDFSGYSDMAIGMARLFGFDLVRNFHFPLFSRSFAEFWRRWHISLNTWFRDYVYIPLGGNRQGTWLTVRNTFVVFLLSGLWHGANWTFVIWGALNAVFMLPSLLGPVKQTTPVMAQGRYFPSWFELGQWALTMAMFALPLVFFRPASLAETGLFVQEILSADLASVPIFLRKPEFNLLLVVSALFFIVEWLNREQDHALAGLARVGTPWVRWPVYLLLFFLAFYLGSFEEVSFVYFQF